MEPSTGSEQIADRTRQKPDRLRPNLDSGQTDPRQLRSNRDTARWDQESRQPSELGISRAPTAPGGARKPRGALQLHTLHAPPHRLPAQMERRGFSPQTLHPPCQKMFSALP